ncbi:MAG TPA: TerC/Alx family metal homeostasis membrane protein [Phycisphaerae bacterium]|jgi:tellurite resistance protein TerC|nr:TerC/Alx family metal homeostasis membrane protein [Phycisphaerae bacterium]HWB95044.1 TerC/Alx family metal homeostasis membrane protein [Bryobacteraceae bacterium]
MNLNHLLAWGLFLTFILMLLALDLFVLHRKPHAIQIKEAAFGALVPVLAACAFVGVVYLAYEHHWLELGIVRDPQLLARHEAYYHPTVGKTAALQFITGYLVELSLSADNVFLFVLLLNFFKTPPELQHRVLFWGVLGALFMRAVMIILGGALLSEFHWVIYVFGAFILFAGFKMFFAGESERDPSRSLAYRLAHKLLPIHPGFVGKDFFTRVNGRRYATTLLVVLLCIEFTDLIFALDSIPAIFGITKDTFLVFTSNVFAILGLRSMYFLLASIIDRFHYLRHGLSFILAFVGLKMLLPLASDVYATLTHTPDPDWHITEGVSLAVILAALTAAVLASLAFPKKSTGPAPAQAQKPRMPETTGSPR